jgi:acetylornithine deacetylase/succinyl-diaminopimelate desuccinylase-like protein
VSGAHAVSPETADLIVNNTWKATLAVTGIDGMPATKTAGNVLLPEICLKLSLRLPPTCDADRAAQAVQNVLERDPPYGAEVSFECDPGARGWNAPSFAPWLSKSIDQASRDIFGRAALNAGCGGTIPFMDMLGRQFPETQFFITGVLGPHSNAHGPNEFLDVEYAKQLTACVAIVLQQHALHATA